MNYFPRLPEIISRPVSEAQKAIALVGSHAYRTSNALVSVLPDQVIEIASGGHDAVMSALSPEGRGPYWRSYLHAVVIPSIIYFLYAALWQTDVYVSETRLTVRAAQEQKTTMGEVASVMGNSIMGKLAGGGSHSMVQDSYLILNYIRSPAIILDLGGAATLQHFFSSDEVDYFSRLRSGPVKIEDLLKYWTNRVSASVDTVSGILTVKVEAFHEADASVLATDIVRVSEKLINNLSMRSRQDALQRAEREVSLAADKLAAARDRLTEFRNRTASIDPAARAASVSETIARLTMDKLTIENALATLQGRLDAESPTQKIQKSRLAAIDQQIAELRKALTDPYNDKAASAQIASYERLKLEEQFDERIYTIAANAYQRARQELEKQQLYLVVVTPPTRPERPTYPMVGAYTLLVFFGLSILWGIAALIAASVSDQMV